MRHFNQRYAFLCDIPLDPRTGYGTASYVYGLMAALSARGRRLGLVAPTPGPLKGHWRRWWFNIHLPSQLRTMDVDCCIGVGLDGYRYADRNDRRPYAVLVERLQHVEARFAAGRLSRQLRTQGRWQEDAIRRADLVLVPSAALRARVISQYGVEATRAHTLEPGIDTDQWRPQPTRNEGHPTTLAAARLVHRKGLDLLIGCWPDVLKSVPQARLIIVGDGPLRTSLQNQIQALGLTTHVAIRSAVPPSQIKHHLAGCDLVCVPSRHEDFSMLALEAMASARAIVGTHTEALAECVGDAAHLVADGDPGALTSGLVDLLTSSERRRHLAEAGVERARTMNWERPALRLGELLSET